jgi:SAM-dependent methyltransferase
MDVEKSTRDFYDKYGWVRTGGRSGEDRLFRQFSPPFFPYHQKVNARVLACFAALSGKLLIAGGGDLPETHVDIARRFADVCCVDISWRALEIAKAKLGPTGEFILGSILNLPLPDDHVDAVYCAHVIYHIEAALQERAVSELIRVTKPGGRVVIIYSNPTSLVNRLVERKKRLPLLWRFRRKIDTPTEQADKERPPLYFATHPLEWWTRFQPRCSVSLIPWDVMSAYQEKELLWTDWLAGFVYRICGWLEKRHPDRAVRWWAYPVVVLEKRAHAAL